MTATKTQLVAVFLQKIADEGEQQGGADTGYHQGKTAGCAGDGV